MFKANLIEDPSYYKLKRNLIFIAVPSAIIGSIIFNAYTSSSSWLILLFVSLFIGSIAYQIRMEKKLKNVSQKRKIEVDENAIQIKSTSGTIEETITIKELDKIIVKSEYSMPEETAKDILNELKGNHLKSFLIMVKGEEKKKVEFTIDSYYMIGQIKNVINSWKNNGYHVETQ